MTKVNCRHQSDLINHHPPPLLETPGCSLPNALDAGALFIGLIRLALSEDAGDIDSDDQ